MKKTFFITGTDTGVGKTVLTALLARFLREQKIRSAALKPICSGGREDARILFRAQPGGASVPASRFQKHFSKLSLDEINPWHFRAPIAPSLAAKRENKIVRLAEVLAHIRNIQKNFDLVLVEGAGGLLSPLGEHFDSRDLISALRATPLIVAQNKLGVVNHVLLTLDVLPKNRRTKAKVVLMSPPKTDAATGSNAKLLAQFMPPQKIIVLPWLGENFETANPAKSAKMKSRLLNLIS